MGKGKFYIKNMELLGYHDLEDRPGFQMAMQVVNGRYYLYLSHFKHSGWTIMDVTDPEKPRLIRFMEGPDLAGQVTLKIQVADGLMLCALGAGIPFLHNNKIDDPYLPGLYIYDVKKDPENPKLLSYWNAGDAQGSEKICLGVHRFFYNGGRYAHLSSTCDGYTNLIYRILDIKDPGNPVEVGRWWMPEQWDAGILAKNKPQYDNPLSAPGMHGPPYVKGNTVYCGYNGSGLVALDISDIKIPRLIGQLPLYPTVGGKLSGARCHTALPLSQRPYVIVTNEGERFPCFNADVVKNVAQPLNILGMVDVSDPADPTLIATFPYPEVPADYPFKNFNECGIGCPGPLGPHNLHEPHDHPALEDRNDRLYCCYFHAGLRVYDLNDPFVPKEIAYFIPPNPTKWCFENTYPGPMLSTTEDVLVDNRGYIFIDTFHDGLYVLRCLV